MRLGCGKCRGEPESLQGRHAMTAIPQVRGRFTKRPYNVSSRYFAWAAALTAVRLQVSPETMGGEQEGGPRAARDMRVEVD